MNPPAPSPKPTANLSRDDLMAALFANLVAQQASLALMFLGKTPHPETGQTFRDVDSARLLIDQLEMLEFKTRGNLGKHESQLLQQNLTSLRLAFVEAVDRPADAAPPSNAAPPAGQPPETPAAADPPESHKKFTKKY
jgi:Domain of unknown function (DUF1844)